MGEEWGKIKSRTAAGWGASPEVLLRVGRRGADAKEIRGRDLRRRRCAGRLTARASLARGVATADGERVERHPGPDVLRSREVHAGGVPERHVRQAALRR